VVILPVAVGNTARSMTMAFVSHVCHSRGHGLHRPGGGLVEAVPGVTAGRTAHGRFLFEMTVDLYEQYGFERVRQIGKHRWIVSRVLDPA
jgi:hypothetical protein